MERRARRQTEKEEQRRREQASRLKNFYGRAQITMAGLITRVSERGRTTTRGRQQPRALRNKITVLIM